MSMEIEEKRANDDDQRMRHPYPVATEMDLMANFRAASAKVAEEERRSKAKTDAKINKSLTRFDHLDDDDDVKTASPQEVTTLDRHASTTRAEATDDEVTSLCTKLDTRSEALCGVDKLRAERRALGFSGAKALASLLAQNALTRLQVLALAQNGLGDLGVTIVADALGPATPLVLLDLASNSFGGAGAQAVARALGRGALPALATLSLKNNDIESQGLAALGNVTHATINWLNLGDNQIADPAPLVDALQAGRFPQLRRLNLDHNLLTDDGMRNLATALGSPTSLGTLRLGLDELYVEYNAAGEVRTKAVEAYFLLDDGDEATKSGPAGARQVCEMVSVNLYRGLGDGCAIL